MRTRTPTKRIVPYRYIVRESVEQRELANFCGGKVDGFRGEEDLIFDIQRRFSGGSFGYRTTSSVREYIKIT